MIGVPATLTAGETFTVTISGASRTSQQITVTIDNGEGGEKELKIDIDENGSGSATFTVPTGWEVLNFKDGRCLQETRVIS